MLTVDAPIILASKANYKFQALTISRDFNGKLSAVVSFNVIGDNGKTVKTQSLRYSASEFNQFWTDFNSGTFLYSELAAEQNLSVAVPDSVEADFVNQTPP